MEDADLNKTESCCSNDLNDANVATLNSYISNILDKSIVSDDLNVIDTERNSLPSHSQNNKDLEKNLTVLLNVSYNIQLKIYPIPSEYTILDLVELIKIYTGFDENEFKITINLIEIENSQTLKNVFDNDQINKVELTINDFENNISKLKFEIQELQDRFGNKINILAENVPSYNDSYVWENNLIGIRNSDDSKAEKNVTWLPSNFHKPFLGGFRNTKTNLIYHNASTQTKTFIKVKKKCQRFCRDTQTYRIINAGQSTRMDMSTQCPKSSFYVSNYGNKIITPGLYETAEKYLNRILNNIIIIQKYVRRWLAQKKVKRLRKQRDDFMAWENEQKELMRKEQEKRLEHNLQRQLEPKTTADFDHLFNMLEMWRQKEVDRIKNQFPIESERKKCLTDLLKKETELIAAITKHQIIASSEAAMKRQLDLLKKAATPHHWISSSGKELEVATTNTLRGKEILEAFETLHADCLNTNERMDILLTVKKMVSQYNNKLTTEIIELIDREAELTIRGIPSHQLAGLRKRIENRFMQFAKLVEVNPGIEKYLPTSVDIKENIDSSIYLCTSCGKYSNGDIFPMNTKETRLPPCEACRRQDNWARKRFDYEPFHQILVELREHEIEQMEKTKEESIDDAKEAIIQCLERGEQPSKESVEVIEMMEDETVAINPFPFLVNKEDIRYIVEDIWGGKSILSGKSDINDLMLSRFRRNEPWSPWNTILTTREEVQAYDNLGKLKIQETYADTLDSVIKQKLAMGRNLFHTLYDDRVKMSKNLKLKVQNMKVFKVAYGKYMNRKTILAKSE